MSIKRDSEEITVLCKCSTPQPAILRTCGETAKPENQGKEFWCCPNDMDNSCKFFQWKDAQPKKRFMRAPASNSGDINTLRSEMNGRYDSLTNIINDLGEGMMRINQMVSDIHAKLQEDENDA